MQQADVFRAAIEILERLQIPYMVVGSAASSMYGEPRLTQDIDIVIDPSTTQVELLCDSFPAAEFYVSKEAAHDALTRRSQFNVIHPDSGNKIDFMIAPDDEWGRLQLTRRKRMPLLPALQGSAAAAEDVIIAKMRYYQEGGSEKHLRDITGIFKITGAQIDRAYIQHWVEEFGLTEIWRAIMNRLGE